jgi:hypothetical protein
MQSALLKELIAARSAVLITRARHIPLAARDLRVLCVSVVNPTIAARGEARGVD